METKKEQRWQQLPPLVLPSPVFALAAWQDKIWAGGVGGVARYAPSQGQGTWAPGVATPLLSPVTTLLALDGLLLAGGSGGIAYSYDSGMTWSQAELEDGVVSVTTFATSPHFVSDQTIVAATLANGIVRTNDGGRTWTNASFGLESLEVTALIWAAGTTVLAATSDGIYRSSDAGRGWRRVYADEELEIEAFVSLPDETILAAQANGGLLRSQNDGKRWIMHDQNLQDVQVSSFFVTSAGTLLLGTLERGLLRSEDAGTSWQSVYEQAVHVCAHIHGNIYAGTDTGVSYSSDDGLNWRELSCPPVHDVRTLLAREEHLLLIGTYSGILCTKDLKLQSAGSPFHAQNRIGNTPAFAWEELESVPQPLTAFAFTPDNALLLSGPAGLLHLSLENGAQQTLIEGPSGQVTHIAIHPAGAAPHLWVASADGTGLRRSVDGGATWQPLRAPFGILPLVSLQAVSDRLLAATYDPRQYRVCLWHSTDDGETWVRSIEANTTWPIVAACSYPAAFSIGNVLFFELSPGQWRQVTVGSDGGAIRRVLGVRLAEKTVLFALTTTGIQRSENMGATWQQDSASLPGEQIMDIAVAGETLYVLLTAGRVWKRVLQEERELV